MRRKKERKGKKTIRNYRLRIAMKKEASQRVNKKKVKKNRVSTATKRNSEYVDTLQILYLYIRFLPFCRHLRSICKRSRSFHASLVTLNYFIFTYILVFGQAFMVSLILQIFEHCSCRLGFANFKHK
jgi:hypothetical protein